ncbi:GNAT family N-acetyltransferase [Reinekea marina]|uniref:GNAT family N-acetyltransferase n=1 Tax=Reinekea marina TaxID=1310421 RepID=A0ABV7WX03_9GAMM|nr:GNAT family N-acetyltransferase [Reinekea marina]MDN3649987.1 GNAT family N-acetyltransferase [Reinekea marina]
MPFIHHKTWSDHPADVEHLTSNPFVSSPFINACEQAQVTDVRSGWQPHHIKGTVNEGHIAVPCYIKSHSWGEYVFDWAWAEAYHQHGLEYYPKLLIAAPFTPSVGPRLLGAQSLESVSALVSHLKHHCLAHEFSGFHILFASEQEQHWLSQLDLLERHDVQFQWNNKGYNGFEDFLATFTSRKRKNVRKERASIEEQNIELRTLEGSALTTADMDAFYYFYHATYLKRGRQGYLNRAFFEAIHQTMAENLVLFMAYKDNKPVAGALCFKDGKSLYGRYWGCIEEFNNLHFETCYYQGIEYCIANNLQHFDPGTQGEHKLARGFEPKITRSFHWLAHEGFMEAAQAFCKQDQSHTHLYFQQTTQSLPFKQPNKDNL